MSFTQELQSWLSPTKKEVQAAPQVGQKAPTSSQLGIPSSTSRPTVVTFLRHCGCPVAEKTFITARDAASKHPDVRFVAVSHSDQDATTRWLEAVGGAGNIDIVVDSDRDIYSQWGLGVSSFWHVLSPWSLAPIVQLGRQEGIWNRPTESGTRWQTAGTYAIDGSGKVVWGGPATAANDVPNFEDVVKAL